MSVEVKIELGHRATQRDKLTVEGFTHDWTVFVRGAEGHNVHYFVEKVVFHLHESFPKPKRVLKDPPYSVSESGYAGFIMPIDVYFRTREEPKKVTFQYDLFLRLEGPPVSNIRIEKLTFQNPSSDFRGKLIKAGGLAGALTSSAPGGSASLSTQACAPPQHADDHQSNPPPPNPKPSVPEKKPRTHIASKEIPTKPAPPPPPKPSHPFTDIFGAPIRTKSSPDSSSVKSKDSGHSSQTKNKSTPNSSSSVPSKEEKPSSKDKESHKLKDKHHTNKESHHPTKETLPSKDSSSSKDGFPPLKEPQVKDSHPPPPPPLQPPPKDSQPSKESHHSSKEKHSSSVKEHHSKEGHKIKDHHSSKSKTPKESRPSESKEPKLSKPIKAEKESSKSSSSSKRAVPTESHSSHGNVEKKKKSSPASSESCDKSSSQSKHKVKEGKNKAEKHKNKTHSNSVKREEEKPKHKSSPVPQPPPPPEPKETFKPKPISPFKAPSPVVKPPSPPPPPPKPQSSPSPPPIVKLPSPISKPPSPIAKPPTPPSPESVSMDSDSEDNRSQRSFYNKAEYSSPASSISESSLPLPGLMNQSILSPLHDEDDDDYGVPPLPTKRKLSSDSELEVDSPEYFEFKPIENVPMPKLKKKHNSHHHSFKHKSSDNYHRGNGSINNDIPVHHSPNLNFQNNCVNNTTYLEELLELQRIIMTSEDRRLLQNIVDLIEQTGKYEVTSTTFDFDLCSLDPAIIHKIKLYLRNCDKYA